MQQRSQILSPPINVTTEQIQRYLDENTQLIMVILENQRLGKFSECTSYQAQLQQNLMYLASIADAQPQEKTQEQPQSTEQAQYLQPSSVPISQQHGSNGQQQQNQPYFLQRQQQVQGQTGTAGRPIAPSGIYQSMQSGYRNDFGNLRGSKQDRIQAASLDSYGKPS
ncbi:GRF1-interacting factor 2-like isoform X2 [Carica papaya]|uniref:GRF1-interacting factor 2-like isoform X2 n=1 Tax=Carica papaya TaxID=3649 RepID=UPI000B8CF28E|nr:GRF1-interacting factor 2-like isoform X2 [Carica papaya]